MNKSLKALFMASMLPVMMLMAAVTLTSCEGMLDDIFGEWSRPTNQQNNEPTKEELLSDLSSALEEGAIVTITYTIDGVEYTSTFKRVGEEYIEQSPAASTRAGIEDCINRDPCANLPTFDTPIVHEIGNEAMQEDLARIKVERDNQTKLEATIKVKSCELVTQIATKGSGVKDFSVNNKKAAVINHETERLTIQVNTSLETGSDVVNVQIPYTPGQTYDKMVAEKQANGGQYMQTDQKNNQVLFTIDGQSGVIVNKDNTPVKPEDVVGTGGGTLRMKLFPPEFYVERSWDATNSKVVSNDKNADNFIMLTDAQTDVTWKTGTYVVNQNVTINGNITIRSNVNLILCDGCTLTVNGSIEGRGGGHAFTIYGQAGGTDLEGTGKLSLTTNRYGLCNFSDFVIHGGNIETSSVVCNDLSNLKMYGGKFSAKVISSDPVIKTRVGKNMTIYGGELDAVSNGTNAIIVGSDTNPGTLTVYGGKVTASSPHGQAIKGYFTKGKDTEGYDCPVGFFVTNDKNDWGEALIDVTSSTAHYFKAVPETE